MEKSSETFGVLGGWFIDGSTARLLSFSWMLLWCLWRGWFLCLFLYFCFLGGGGVVEVAWYNRHTLLGPL